MFRKGMCALLFLSFLTAVSAEQPVTRVRTADYPLFKGIGSSVENGHVVARTGPPRPQMWVYGRDGKLVNESQLWLLDTSASAWDVAVREDGTAAAAVKLWRRERTATTSESAILLIEKPGKITQVIRTDPFFAMRVCFGPDGAIWAFGRDDSAEQAHRDYEVFEKYSLDGKRIGKFVKRSVLGGAAHPAEPGGQALLRASKDRIGAYSPALGQWLELNLKGQVAGRWTVGGRYNEPPNAPAWRIDLIAFTASGEVYAQMYELSGPAGFIYLARLDREKGSFVPLPGPQAAFADLQLRGSDGDQLVLLDLRARPNRLVWVRFGGEKSDSH